MAPRNADIRSFFTSSQAAALQQPASRTPTPPIPTTAPAPAPPAQIAPEASDAAQMSPIPPVRTPTHKRAAFNPPRALSSPSPSPLHDTYSLTSSPPSVAPRRAFGRDAVIAASDDEDGLGSSDSELPDIMASVMNTKRVVEDEVETGRGQVTPRATKRAATAIKYDGVLFSSPLSIRKKHKYDMKALAKMNERDEAAVAGEERVRQLDQEANKEEGNGNASGDEHSEDNIVRELKQQFQDSVAMVGDDDDDTRKAKEARLMRAIERLAKSSHTGQKTFYFFEQTELVTEASIVGNAFPIAQATGPWKILADKQDRARHFQSGLPYDIQTVFGNLPDELFLWALNEICQERPRQLAVEYVKLLRNCHEQVGRLVTPTLLHDLFKSLGATENVSTLKHTVTLTDELSDPYKGRSWTCLEHFLNWLGMVSSSLGSAARTTSMQILLRLGMDKVAVENFGLAQEWRWTVDLIARSVPGGEWTSFCQEICTSIYQSTEKATLRYKAINLLGPVQRPESPPDLQRRTLDLKRRLASVFFFDELSRADKKPEDTVNIRAVIDRLEDPPFIFNSKTSDADFAEIAASMLLMNIALGDAAKQQTVLAPGSGKEFDAEVDKLAAGLKGMSTRIKVGGHEIRLSRIDAKNAMDILHDRLLFQVRTRRVPKLTDMPEDEPGEQHLPKQQSLLEHFQKRKMDKARPSVETAVAG